MVLQMPGGVSFSPRTDAWKHHYSLSDAGRVYLRLPADGSYRLTVEKGAAVSIGTLVAVLKDESPVYATVSGTFDGLFSLHERLYAGVTDNGRRSAVPVRDPETRPLEDIPKEELVEAIRDLAVFDTRRDDLLWKTLPERIGNTRRILVDLTDDVTWSFSNYDFGIGNMDDVIGGAKVLCSLLGAAKIVLITDSSRKKMKRAAEEALHGDPAVSVAEVAVRYPCLESTLLSAIYNTAPNSKHPEMFFVSGPSAAAVFRGLVTGFPHTEQTITASGKGFGNPCVLRVPIGTTWKTILRFCKHKGGAYLTKTGSPLTGEPASGICRVDQDRVFSFTEQPGDPSPCISCGKCASVCPVGLYPFLIHRTRNYRHVKSMSSACIGCGCCAFACPSHIPLNELIRKYANKEDADHV